MPITLKQPNIYWITEYIKGILHRTLRKYSFVTVFPLMAGLETEQEYLAPLSSELMGLPPFN